MGSRDLALGAGPGGIRASSAGGSTQVSEGQRKAGFRAFHSPDIPPAEIRRSRRSLDSLLGGASRIELIDALWSVLRRRVIERRAMGPSGGYRSCACCIIRLPWLTSCHGEMSSFPAAVSGSVSSREGEQQSEVPAPTLSSYSWDLLAEQVEMTPWSIAAREAGLWSLERLQAEFGPRWPPAWREPGGMPAEIASCFWALTGLCGTISLALAFERLKGAKGLPVLRKTIKRGTDQGRFASLRLQVRQGALARSAALTSRSSLCFPGVRRRPTC